MEKPTVRISHVSWANRRRPKQEFLATVMGQPTSAQTRKLSDIQYLLSLKMINDHVSRKTRRITFSGTCKCLSLLLGEANHDIRRLDVAISSASSTWSSLPPAGMIMTSASRREDNVCWSRQTKIDAGWT
jgi:hypothetical protein